MFKTIKNILIGVLSAVIVIAIGASAYTAFASNPVASAAPAVDPSVDTGYGNGDEMVQINPLMADPSADAGYADGSGYQGTNEQGANGNGYGGTNGQGGQSAQGQAGGGVGVPQANIAGAVTVHGVVSSYDGMGIGITADDGQALYVDTGNPRYSQSLGFAPQVGEGVTALMFMGDQGVNSAISVTMDATGMTYTFRSEIGQPLWSGGNGRGGNGNRP
jgi:hypothetical protein